MLLKKLLPLIMIYIFSLGINDIKGQNKKKSRRIAKVIGVSRSYIGTPYVYGGQSKRGIDCSGLIQSCYAAIDVKIPRTAKQQSKIGTTKSWGNVREGDIVFFKFKQKGEKWWHSGLISKVDGKNIKFIHASSSKGVVESNLMSDYYKKNVKRFRRVIR